MLAVYGDDETPVPLPREPDGHVTESLPRLGVRAVNDLSSVNPADWDALDHGQSPFLEHGFLRSLEVSGSIGGDSGWAPIYLLAEIHHGAEGANGAEAPTLVGAVPCFVKSHSYGEYIFDWGWARASARARVPYYPKLVIAAPVTPATGRRILIKPGLPDGLDRRAIADVLISAVRDVGEAVEVSSIHWLFCTHEEQGWLAEHDFMSRASFQFHWHNQDYADFDAFLATMASRKRKQIRKERRRALEVIDTLEFIPGEDWTDDDVACVDKYYRVTCLRHGGQDWIVVWRSLLGFQFEV